MVLKETQTTKVQQTTGNTQSDLNQSKTNVTEQPFCANKKSKSSNVLGGLIQKSENMQKNVVEPLTKKLLRLSSDLQK